MLALLEVFSPNLLFRDQRTHHRIKTRLPIQIELSEGGAAHPCLLNDYSELHAHIEFGEESKILRQLKENASIIITLKLEHSHRSFVIATNVMRKQQSSIVVAIEKISRNGPFELMDALDIKASLLQHPGTN